MKLKTAIDEVWKDIPQHKDLYQASNIGRIKSLARIVLRENGSKYRVREKMLTSFPDKFGYLRVGLSNNGVYTQAKVHKLVAQAFLGHTPNGMDVVIDHINGIKTDNRVENLQVTSQRVNRSKGKDGETSKYVGVHWHKRRCKWQALIHVKGKRVYLGGFNTEEEANEAYQNKLKTL